MSFKFATELAEDINNIIQEDKALNLSDDEEFGKLLDFLYGFIDKIDADETKTYSDKTNELLAYNDLVNKFITDSVNERIALIEGSINAKVDYYKTSDELTTEQLYRKREAMLALVRKISAKVKEYSFRKNTAKYNPLEDSVRIHNKVQSADDKHKKIVKAMGVTDNGINKDLKSFTKSFEHEVNRSEMEMILLSKFRLAKMSFETKHEITVMQNKFFKRLKTVLALLGVFFMSKAVKKVASGIIDTLEPYYKPFIDWFVRNMNPLYDYVKKMAGVFKPIGEFLKPFTEFYKEYFNEEARKQRVLDAMHTMGADGKMDLLTIEELQNATKITGEQMARMLSYATIGGSAGMLVGSIIPGVGNAIGGAIGAVGGALVAFTVNRHQQRKVMMQLKDYYDDLEKSLKDGIKELERNKKDPFDIQAMRVALARVRYCQRLMLMARFDHEVFYGLMPNKALVKAAEGALNTVRKEEDKLARMKAERGDINEESVKESEMDEYVRARLNSGGALKEITQITEARSSSSSETKTSPLSEAQEEGDTQGIQVGMGGNATSTQGLQGGGENAPTQTASLNYSVDVTSIDVQTIER